MPIGTDDPLDPRLLRQQNQKELIRDVLRNAAGLPENLLSMGTGLASMAGTGLGVGAGMLTQALRGDRVDPDAAAEATEENIGRFTFAPRSTAGQEFARGMGTVGEAVDVPFRALGRGAQLGAEQLGASPEVAAATGAGVYALSNILDPEIAAAGAAKVAALRGAQRVARSTPTAPVQRRGGIGTRQEGAWSPGDIEDTEGSFEMRSTVEDALTRLKPQEQRARGKQMLQVLKKYGAKEDELKWTGLNDILAGDMPVTADDIAQHVQNYGVEVGQSRRGASAPEVPKGALELDDEAVYDRARELAYESGDLEYPYRVTRDGEEIGTANSRQEARELIEAEKNSMIESETEYYLENISEHFDAEQLARMSDEDKQHWAETMADDSVRDNMSWDYEVDTDAEPHNLESTIEDYIDAIRENPQDYGMGHAANAQPAKWAQYTMSDVEGKQGENYGETITQLQREGRYGRGISIDTYNTPANWETMTPFQRARHEALRTARQDPLTQKATTEYKYTTHFPESNPLIYTRESDWPKPPGAETEGGMRMLEEVQSDWAQHGRKKGIYDPEEARAQREKMQAQLPQQYGELRDEATRVLDALRPEEQRDLAQRMGVVGGDVAELRQRLLETYELALRDPNIDFAHFISNFGDNAYYAAVRMADEEAARALANRGHELYGTMRGTTAKGVPPAPFIDDPKKVAQLALQQAIADAVRRGDQYVGISPGYSHAPERWGSESLAWWTDPTAPGRRRVAARAGSQETTRGEGWQDIVRQLRNDPDALAGQWNNPSMLDIDPNDPSAQAQMEMMVRNNLAHEMGQYADPEKFIKDRAAKILDNMRAAEEGEYSPRTHGMTEYYDKMLPNVMAKILRESGSSGSGKGVVRGAEAPIGRPMARVWDETQQAWRPRNLSSQHEVEQYRELATQQPDKYQFEPAQVHYVEIDPELARAAKRGFKLPF